MEGLRLACVYSYGCHKSNIVGADRVFWNFIANLKPGGEKLDRIRGLLTKLEPYSSYRAIASLCGQRDCFSEEVVRAYWLGQEDLNSSGMVKYTHNFSVLRKIKGLKDKLSERAVKKLLDCCVTLGEVISTKLGVLAINHRIFDSSGGLFLREERRRIKRLFVRSNLKPGDLLSVHLDSAREKISEEQAQILIKGIIVSLRILTTT